MRRNIGRGATPLVGRVNFHIGCRRSYRNEKTLNVGRGVIGCLVEAIFALFVPVMSEAEQWNVNHRNHNEA